jgi:hypothetical protein
LSHALIIEDESCNIFKVGHAKLFPTSTKEYRKGIHGIDLYGSTERREFSSWFSEKYQLVFVDDNHEPCNMLEQPRQISVHISLSSVNKFMDEAHTA